MLVFFLNKWSKACHQPKMDRKKIAIYDYILSECNDIYACLVVDRIDISS